MVQRDDVLAGINIGGTTTSVVAARSDGIILARWNAPTPVHDGSALVAMVTAAVLRIAPSARRVGVAVGGPVDVLRGVVLNPPHLPGLWNVALRERLESTIGLPVSLHHDAAACALAEYAFGPHGSPAGLVYLTCGTGFGAGIVIHGKAHYGSNGRSPEIGHIRFADDGPDIFGKPGCYEGYASANALRLLARFRASAYEDSTPAEIVAAAASNEPVARWALEENMRAVGQACALIADLLLPDVIVLGSLAQYLGSQWITGVHRIFQNEVLDAPSAPRIVSALRNVQDLSGIAAAYG